MERNWRVTSSGSSLVRGAIISGIIPVPIAFITATITDLPSYAIWLGGFGLAIAIFSNGLVKVETAFQFAKQLLGDRTGEVITEGWAWIFKPFYSGDLINARDKHVDIGEKEYVSKDNVPVKADASCVIGFDNVAQAQSYEGNLEELVENVLEGAVRLYMLKQPAVASFIFSGNLGNLTEEEVTEVRAAVTHFKTEMETTGREYVAEKVNSAIAEYGAKCRRVLIENIRLPQSIEDAGGEALRETLESAGDMVDWQNTIEMATALRRALYTDNAWNQVPRAKRGELMNEFIAAVQAKKGQVQRISFTGGSSSLTEAAAILGDKK